MFNISLPTQKRGSMVVVVGPIRFTTNLYAKRKLPLLHVPREMEHWTWQSYFSWRILFKVVI